MNILEWVVLAISSVLCLSWAYGIRTYVHQGRGISHQTVNTTMLGFTAIAMVLILNASPLHLFWLLPCCWLIGTLSLMLPFSLLSIPGRLFKEICCIGLNKNEVELNEKKVGRLTQLVNSGMSPNEAAQKVKKEFEKWGNNH